MNLFTRSHVVAFRDQVTCLQASLMQRHRDGHMYLSVTWTRQILVLICTPLRISSENLSGTFLITLLRDDS